MNELSTGKALALWEIVSVVVSCLIAEWLILSLARDRRWLIAVPVGLALALILASHRVHGESLRDLGFRLDNFFAALKRLAFPTLAAVLVLFGVGWVLRDHATSFALRPRFLLVPFWALFQQYVLQGFINRRSQLAFGPGWLSVGLVAVVFSVAHFPNPLLASLTFTGGVIWARVYQSEPNLFALAVSHLATSLAVTLAIPLEFITGLRVGFKFFG